MSTAHVGRASSLAKSQPGAPLGILLHSPGWYDFQVWLALGGRERALREAIVRISRLQPGEAMLDVGCGTGSLAVMAARTVGPAGKVVGIDASPEMVVAARDKARKAGASATFQEAAAQRLPFADASFDLVTSVVMLHHLPRQTRQACVAEMARVLKPGGRALAVEFASSSQAQGGPLHRLHRHGFVHQDEIVGLLEGAGLSVADSGEVGMRDIRYVLASAQGVAL